MRIHRTSLLAGAAALALALTACDSQNDQAGLAPADAASDPRATSTPDMIDLAVIENPEALRTAPVTNIDGQAIGSVESVEVGADGRLAGLIIELHAGDTVRATAMQAQYDERDQQVALRVDVDQLAQAG